MRLMEGVWVPGFLATLLHAVLAYLMFMNWSTQLPKLHTTPKFDHIAAKLVILPENVVAPAPAAPPKAIVESSPPPEDQFEAARAEPIETPRQNDPTYNKKQEKPKPKPREEPKRVREPRPDPQALARMRERAAQIRAKQQAKSDMEQAMRQEQSFSNQQADAEVTQSYIALIKRVIENNWSRPLSARNGMQTELLIQLVPSGDIVSVSIVRSSGDAAFDRSAENAVKKAGRFPEIRKMPSRTFEREFRRLRFIFRPEDLRS